MKVLFLCKESACLSRMAEAFALARPHDDVEITSASIESGPCHPMTIKVMAEVGIDLSSAVPTTMDELDRGDFDVVITLCRGVVTSLPVLPGFPVCVNWDLLNPGEVTGKDDHVLTAFRQSRDDIKRLVDNYREIPEDDGYFYDWGTQNRFSLLKGQKAECCAGVFDMIDIDLKAAKQE